MLIDNTVCIYIYLYIWKSIFFILSETDELMLAMTFNYLSLEAFFKTESRNLYLVRPPTGQIQHSNFLVFPYFIPTQNFGENQDTAVIQSLLFPAITPFRLKILQLGSKLAMIFVFGSCRRQLWKHTFILCDWLMMEVFAKAPWVKKCQFLCRIHISSLVVFSHIWAFKKTT